MTKIHNFGSNTACADITAFRVAPQLHRFPADLHWLVLYAPQYGLPMPCQAGTATACDELACINLWTYWSNSASVYGLVK